LGVYNSAVTRRLFGMGMEKGMRRIALVVALAGIAAGLVETYPLFGMGGDYPQGKPVTPQPDWPAGLAGMINTENRTVGWYVNANDFFAYTGNTETLNAFLAQFAALKAANAKVVLHAGKGQLGEFESKDNGIKTLDWRLDIIRWARPPEKPGMTVHVWLGGNVNLDALKMPGDVTVESGQEIEKFVAAHAQTQKALTTTTSSPTTQQRDK
jgi:hypothetical protein